MARIKGKIGKFGKIWSLLKQDVLKLKRCFHCHKSPKDMVYSYIEFQYVI